MLLFGPLISPLDKNGIFSKNTLRSILNRTGLSLRSSRALLGGLCVKITAVNPPPIRRQPTNKLANRRLSVPAEFAVYLIEFRRPKGKGIAFLNNFDLAVFRYLPLNQSFRNFVFHIFLQCPL